MSEQDYMDAEYALEVERREQVEPEADRSSPEVPESEIVAQTLRDMAAILAESPAVAEVPFTLTAEPARRKAKQGGLFG